MCQGDGLLSAVGPDHHIGRDPEVRRDQLDGLRVVVNDQHGAGLVLRLVEAQVPQCQLQRAGADRLLQNCAGASGQRQWTLGSAGAHHERHHGQAGILTDGGKELPPIDTRSFGIYGDQIEVLLGRHLERLQSTTGAQDNKAFRLQKAAHQVCGKVVILDHQCDAIDDLRGCSHLRLDISALGGGGRGEHLKRDPGGEARPLALSAGHGHGSAEQLAHLLDHCQAQPGALELTRQTAVDLGKGLEQLGQVLLGDTYACIGDADLKEVVELVLGQLEAAHGPGALQRPDGASRDLPGAQGHQIALAAELDRVGEQVVDDLFGLAHVQLGDPDVLVQLEIKANTASQCLLPHDGQGIGQELPCVHELHLKVHHPGFDL